jgi:hypothetical protein
MEEPRTQLLSYFRGGRRAPDRKDHFTDGTLDGVPYFHAHRSGTDRSCLYSFRLRPASVRGLREGATENATVVRELLEDMARRGLDFVTPRFYVLDRAEALSAAVKRRAGEAASIQRCQVHKRRNVLEQLPEEYQPLPTSSNPHSRLPKTLPAREAKGDHREHWAPDRRCCSRRANSAGSKAIRKSQVSDDPCGIREERACRKGKNGVTSTEIGSRISTEFRASPHKAATGVCS